MSVDYSNAGDTMVEYAFGRIGRAEWINRSSLYPSVWTAPFSVSGKILVCRVIFSCFTNVENRGWLWWMSCVFLSLFSFAKYNCPQERVDSSPVVLRDDLSSDVWRLFWEFASLIECWRKDRPSSVWVMCICLLCWALHSLAVCGQDVHASLESKLFCLVKLLCFSLPWLLWEMLVYLFR